MNDCVSRETALASQVFGEQLPVAERFRGWLAGAGVERGLIGPREVDRLWERHLLNCAVALDGVPTATESLADVGSGAGLPGLVWAVLRPDLPITLVEPMARRCAFLEEVAADLGLSAVTVERRRAEDLAGVTSFDVVTARAVAPLDRLARWCLPLVKPGGVLLALKGRTAEEEVQRARPALHRMVAASVAVEEYGADLLETPTRVVRVQVRSLS